MRKRFETQLKLGQVPIENVKLPQKSRDELPAVLRTLQWIYSTPEISKKIFAALEKKILGNKKLTGRNGMDLWHIFVLGIVRLALDCDYDRIEYLVHYDKLMRQIMGLESSFEGCKSWIEINSNFDSGETSLSELEIKSRLEKFREIVNEV